MRPASRGRAKKGAPVKPHFAKLRPKKEPDHPPAPVRLRYILFHKPYEVLCQFTPEGGKKCLKDFVDVPGVYPCGRLDWDSEGLVLLTNDGPLIERMLSPRYKLAKTYWAQVDGAPDEAALTKLRNGVVIEGGSLSQREFDPRTQRAHPLPQERARHLAADADRGRP
jgi:23S rRNA pseudouridine2457 synthase